MILTPPHTCMRFMVWNSVRLPISTWKRNIPCRQNYWHAIQNRLIESAHDVSEGGLFVTLAECGFHRNLGFTVLVRTESIRRDAYWFGESQSRVVVSVKKEKTEAIKKAMQGISLEKLGEVTSSHIQVDNELGRYPRMEI